MEHKVIFRFEGILTIKDKNSIIPIQAPFDSRDSLSLGEELGGVGWQSNPPFFSINKLGNRILGAHTRGFGSDNQKKRTTHTHLDLVKKDWLIPLYFIHLGRKKRIHTEQGGFHRSKGTNTFMVKSTSSPPKMPDSHTEESGKREPSFVPASSPY